MKVIICEDDEAQLHFIHTKLKQYAFIEHSGIDFVLVTSKPEDVLFYIEKNQADCYFLDIELESHITGLELASKIREYDPLSSIIFVTTHAEMLQLTFTYKIAALDFIIKREQEELTHQLIAALETAYQKYKQLGLVDERHFFQVKIGELIKNIPYDEICYFSTSTQIHKVQLQTKNGHYEFYGKLKDIEKLDGRFYRCHKSFIINIDHVQEIDKKNRTVTMTNGEICFISFRSIRGLQEKIKKVSVFNK
ncbi:LytR/AlgR family response regulator transcription factor [Rummeliibacillus pycnus]|uniref:LytR/AlgR family response regulator transcription factor n=1 Tax=Rummeliibacillus pycnus TaxID=101070 RepID=UPI0037CA97D1